MPRKLAAGCLVRADFDGETRYLIVHPSGRYNARSPYSIPKGIVEPGEDLLAAACREYCEETGQPCPEGPFESLGSVVLASGKIVHAWAVLGDCDAIGCRSNTFQMEWPRGSGKQRTYPELDRFGWFTVGDAARKLNPAQAPLIERACAWLTRHQP